MEKRIHIKKLTYCPTRAQVSNFQIKLQATTDIIDRLLLAHRQAPWKATGPSEETTETGTEIPTGGTTLPGI